MRELVLGIDLGATKILTGIVGRDGTLLGQSRLPTPVNDSCKVLNRMVESAHELVQVCGVREEEITGIAIAAPGPLAFPAGVVRDSPNLGWEQVQLKQEMSQRFGRPVTIEKDTNMAVLGEYYYGRYCNCEELLYITVSTGIGAGIITSGKLYRGKIGGAGELGHMVIESNGAQCKCGRQGCLEALASGSAISRQLDELLKQGHGQGILACSDAGQRPGPRELGLAARQGDQEARSIIARVVEYLGIGITNMANVLNPEVVILGGGVMLGLKDLLLQPVQDYVYQHAFALNRDKLVIDCTDLGDDVVLYGCVAAVNNSKS